MAAIGLALLAGSCAENSSDKDLSGTMGCTSGSAQIGIFGSFAEPLCGCQEGSGVPVNPPAHLTCTVSAGTTVLFQLMEPATTHQIVSVGDPSFPASSVDTMDEASPAVHPVYFATPGRYHFEDGYNTAIQGDIIVQ